MVMIVGVSVRDVNIIVIELIVYGDVRVLK